jgi:hypothetical protein
MKIYHLATMPTNMTEPKSTLVDLKYLGRSDQSTGKKFLALSICLSRFWPKKLPTWPVFRVHKYIVPMYLNTLNFGKWVGQKCSVRPI